MKKISKNNKIFRIIRFVYLKLFRTNDSPQRIAIGLGIGVCLGVMPFTGPIASIFVASIFRVNRASAFLGSVLTNSWLSLVFFLVSVKTGAFFLGLNWHKVYSDGAVLLKGFHWAKLTNISVLKIIFPVLLGYLTISVFFGILAYLISLIFLLKSKKRRKIV